MLVLKKTGQQVFALPTLPLLLGKDLGNAGKVWLDTTKRYTRPDKGYVDVVSADNCKHVMRVKLSSLKEIKDTTKSLEVIGAIFA